MKLTCNIYFPDETHSDVLPKLAQKDRWNYQNGYEDLREDMVVAINPVNRKDVLENEPWLAIVNTVMKTKIKVSWLTGTYNSKWELNPDFEGCDPDNVPIKRVACHFNYIPDEVLPELIIKKLRRIFLN